MAIANDRQKRRSSLKSVLTIIVAASVAIAMHTVVLPGVARADGPQISVGIGVLQTLLSSGGTTRGSTKSTTTKKKTTASKVTKQAKAKPRDDSRFPTQAAGDDRPTANKKIPKDTPHYSVASAKATKPSAPSPQSPSGDPLPAAMTVPAAPSANAAGAPADAASAKIPTATAPAVDAPTISTIAEITAAQQHLRFLGYDVPSDTGVLDLKTKIAILQFQESIKAPTTGSLTVQQLQGLFRAVANRQAKLN